MAGEWDTNTLLQAIKSGELSKNDVNSYLSKLVLELSRAKIDLQKQVEAVKAERDEALGEVDRLREEKDRMSCEIDSGARRSAELDNMVREYEVRVKELNELLEIREKEAEEKLRAARSEYRSGPIRETTRISSDGEPEQQTTRSFDAMNAELEKTVEEAKRLDSDPEPESAGATQALSEPFYNRELMTSSGFDLLAMLQGMADSTREDSSAVQLSRSWEEESEEISADPNVENGQIVKKIRKKTEVSVKYTNGKS